MSNTPTPPINPAEAILGSIPIAGAETTGYTGVPGDYVPPSGRKPKRITINGKETELFYNTKLDANVILNSLSPESRKQILTGLATKGAYGSQQPGNGFEEKDKNAFADLLEYANIVGLPYAEAYRDFMQRVPSSTSLKKAPSVRLTSPDDLKVVFRKASQDLLGYELDDATAQRFTKSYQQMEMAEGQRQAAGGAYVSAAAPSTVAEQQIRKQFGAEVQAVQAGDYAAIMDRRIKELGA